MPVHCPIQLQKLSEEEFRKIDYEVMRHAFASQRELGRLCSEEVYQNDLALRLKVAGFQVQTEVPVTVSHKDFAKRYALDLVTEDAHLGELKAAAMLTGDHERQLLNYLMLLDVAAASWSISVPRRSSIAPSMPCWIARLAGVFHGRPTT